MVMYFCVNLEYYNDGEYCWEEVRVDIWIFCMNYCVV